MKEDEARYCQRNNRPELRTTRKSLRNEGTSAEATLWRLLKNKQLDGGRWRRQFSVGPYILDFYCPQAKLAVELDGMPHFTHHGADSVWCGIQFCPKSME